ncbi:MAG TPA: FtsX-like permease family protein, partial [Acidimicrobiales bacterium]|nr:FtsX-like permease family protein [Acidimicrobiales bacterium]
QINFSDLSGGKGGPDPALLASLEHDPTVTGLTEGFATNILIEKVTVGAIVAKPLKGPMLLSTVSGQLPNGGGQVGLGVKTMREAKARIGSVVRVTLPLASGGRAIALFRVVSQVSFPVLGGVTSLGNGAVFTLGGFEQMACPPGHRQVQCREALFVNATAGGLLASFVPGPRGQAAVDHYLVAYPSIAAPSIKPTSLVNFGEAFNFPLIFAAMLAVFGAATLLHLLVVSVSRRRYEIGLLKALGFVNAQVSAAVAWQATTLAVVGVVVGAPLGIATGRAVWSAFANNLGAMPVSVVQSWLITVLVAGVLAAANLLAVVPALAARRSIPQELLHTQ